MNRRATTGTVSPRRSSLLTSCLDENSSPISTKSSIPRRGSTPTKKKPSLNDAARRPAARPMAGGRRSLGNVVLNGVPRTLSSSLNAGSKDSSKPTRIMEAFDLEGNKENIAPFRLASLSVFSPSRPRRSTSTMILPTISAPLPTTTPRLPPPTFSFHTLRHETKVDDSDTDSDDDDCAQLPGTPTKCIFLNDSPPRYTRSITPYQRDGKFVLKFGKLTPCSSGSSSATDSGSDSDTDIFGSPGLGDVSEGDEIANDSDLSDSSDDGHSDIAL